MHPNTNTFALASFALRDLFGQRSAVVAWRQVQVISSSNYSGS
jgi:hypothetical protein